MDAALLKVRGDLDQVADRARQAIQAPHHNRIASPGVFKHFREFGAILTRAARLLNVDQFALGLSQRVFLQRCILVLGRNPGISNEHCGSLRCLLSFCSRFVHKRQGIF